MSDSVCVFSTPPGRSEFEGAVCTDGWAFFWDGQSAFVTSGQGDWFALPLAPDAITAAHTMGSGAVVRTSSGYGLWLNGQEGWSEWVLWGGALPILPALIVSEDYVCVSEGAVEQGSAYEYGFYEVRNGRFERRDTIRWSGGLGPVAVWKDAVSGYPVILNSEGIHRVEPDVTGNGVPRLVHPAPDLHMLNREGVFRAGDRLFLSIRGEDILELDLSNWALSHTGLGCLPGCRHLWKAYVRNDRAMVGRIIDTLQRFDPGEPWMRVEVADVLVRDDIPIGIATKDGFVRVCDLPRETPVSDKTRTGFRGALLSWKLWLSPNQYLPESLDESFRESGTASGLLARAISRAAGADAMALLFDHVRGKMIPSFLSNARKSTEALAACQPRESAQHVRSALCDPDPYVALLAAAASGATRDAYGTPVLWTSRGEIPVRELISLMSHASPQVRVAALQACVDLKLPESAMQLTALLQDRVGSVRAAAIRALRDIGPMAEDASRRIEGLITGDPDGAVRAAAVEAVADLPCGPQTIDTLLHALGDTEGRVRDVVSRALCSHAGHLSAAHALALSDIVTVLFLAPSPEKDPYRHPSDVEDIFQRLLRALFPDSDAFGEHVVLSVPAPLVEPAFALLLLSVCCELAFKGRSDRDMDDKALEGILGMLGRGHLATDLGALKGGRGVWSAMANFTLKIAGHDRALASRLSTFVLYLAGSSAAARQSGAHPRAGGDPLHVRLRGMGTRAKAAIEECERMIEERVSHAGIEGLSALYLQMGLGNAGAAKELAERILLKEGSEWPVIVTAFILAVGRKAQTELGSRLIVSKAWPLQRRLAIVSDWDEKENGELAKPALRELSSELAANGSLSFSERAEAAVGFASLGDTTLVERIVGEMEAAGDAENKPEWYKLSRAMAAAGHAEYLKFVRMEWIKRGELAALKAFAVSGTIEDIAELEYARDEFKCPAERVKEAIDAIRARHEGGTGVGP